MFGWIKRVVPNRYKRIVKNMLQNCVQSFHYYILDGQLFDRLHRRPKAIVFVCKGNICRSAFAEARLKNLLLNCEGMIIDSCGLDVDQGMYPPSDSIVVAAEFSCNLAGRRAKSVMECDIEGADLILPMEYAQYNRLIELYPHKKKVIRLLREYASFPQCLFCNIADPYGWGKGEVRRAFGLISQAVTKIV